MKENKQLGLNEIRLQFDRENSRKQNLESKASYILGIISLMTTILITITMKMVFNSNFIFRKFIIIFTIITLIISSYFCIKVLKNHEIFYPYRSLKPNEFKDYFDKNKNDLKENLYDSYLSATYVNNIKNNEKADNINYSFCFLILGTISLMILIIISFKVIL